MENVTVTIRRTILAGKFAGCDEVVTTTTKKALLKGGVGYTWTAFGARHEVLAVS